MTLTINRPIRVGDTISDRHVTGEVLEVGTFRFGRLSLEAYRIRILGGPEAGKESFIAVADNPTRWLTEEDL